MKNKFENSRNHPFIEQLEKRDSEFMKIINDLHSISRFNFKYFDQNQNKNIAAYTESEKNNLLQKLLELSHETLANWKVCGKGKRRFSMLEEYGEFPKRSDYTKPKHIPEGIRWARFRFDSNVRLVGFVIPKNYKNEDFSLADLNTFFVVFYDLNHSFYKIGG